MPGLKRGPKPRQSLRLRDLIVERIRSGVWPPGFVLPSGRELALLVGASQPTIVREVRRLVADGLLRADGDRRVVAGATSHLMARVVACFTCFASGDAATPIKNLPQWDTGLELFAHQRLLAQQWRSWCMPAEQLSDAELAGLGRDPPAGALLFAANLPTATTRRITGMADRARIPLAVYGHADDHPAHDSVWSDQRAGGRLLAEELARRGARRLAAFAHPPPTPRWHDERHAGYRAGAIAAGLDAPRILLRPGNPAADGTPDERLTTSARSTAEVLRPLVAGELPLGILALSDGDVPTTWMACRLLGLEPGRDALVAGYDGYWPDLAERRWEPMPPTISIDKRHAEMGCSLADLLTSRIGGGLPPEPQHLALVPELITHWPA